MALNNALWFLMETQRHTIQCGMFMGFVVTMVSMKGWTNPLKYIGWKILQNLKSRKGITYLKVVVTGLLN